MESAAGPTRDDEMHAYFACPKGKERLPGVLIIHDAMGVTSHIEDVVRRFAKARFAALAPNLYIKHSPPPVDDQPTILTALAHVVVTEGLVDEKFVRERCEWDAFQDWAAFVAQEHNSPEAVGRLAGVPAATARSITDSASPSTARARPR